MKQIAQIALIFLVFTGNGFGQITISGGLSGILADTLYLVVGDIYVTAGDSLIIPAGAEFGFASGSEFQIRGVLLAQGTEEDSILFTAQDAAAGWLGMRFIDAGTGSVTDYCFIRGGKAGGTGIYQSGGGVYCANSQPVISHCRIADNWAAMFGGGIYLNHSSPVISDCVIENNIAHNYQGAKGGGIACEYQSNPVIENCIISGNYAGDDGGGIYCFNSAPMISGCIIEENRVVEWGGGICNGWSSNITVTGCLLQGNSAGEGGGMYFYDSDAVMDNCSIIGNWCEGGNPPYSFNHGGGIFLGYTAGSDGSNLVLTNSIIQDNAARNGGGIYNEYLSSIRLSNCDIEDNTAILDGGGIFSASNSMTTSLSGCRINSNEAGRSGGGMFTAGVVFRSIRCIMGGNEAGWNGGGIVFTGSDNNEILNNVFYANFARNNGSALFFYNSPVNLTNSVVNGSLGDYAVYMVSPLGFELGYNDFFANNGADFGGTGIPGNLGIINAVNANGDSCDHYRNIYLNPLFLDPMNGDFHLTAGSPCIDAGNPWSPLDPDSTTVDIGAFYYPQDDGSRDLTSQGKDDKSGRKGRAGITVSQSGQFQISIRQTMAVDVSLFDILGRRAVRIDEGTKLAGDYMYYTADWEIASGVYFVVLRADGEVYTGKIVMLK